MRYVQKFPLEESCSKDYVQNVNLTNVHTSNHSINPLISTLTYNIVSQFALKFLNTPYKGISHKLITIIDLPHIFKEFKLAVIPLLSTLLEPFLDFSIYEIVYYNIVSKCSSSINTLYLCLLEISHNLKLPSQVNSRSYLLKFKR